MTVNTRILKAQFEYLVPDALQEAVQLLEQYGADAKVIAGGTDLLVQMKKEVISPRYLIDIMKIADLSFIKTENGWLRIGAATKWSEFVEFCSTDRKYAALYEASRSIGKVQVRNMGTIGGNLCTASPAADSAPPLLLFDSRVKLCNVQGERILELRDFFKGVNVTVMAPNDIMAEIQIPSIKDGTGSAFMKTTRVGSDIAKISCAVAVERQGDLCTSCRIAMGAVAPIPMRAIETEGIVAGKKVDAPLVDKMGQRIAAEINPITDIRSTAEYRRQVAAILLKDVFWKAWKRAGGKE